MIHPNPQDESVWHEWFAWRPIVIAGYIVWLETVKRRKAPLCWEYFSQNLMDHGVDH